MGIRSRVILRFIVITTAIVIVIIIIICRPELSLIQSHGLGSKLFGVPLFSS